MKFVIIETYLQPLMEEHSYPNFVTERELYDFVFLDKGKVGGKGLGMNWEVTRREFHAFLRWCDARRYMFR
jgi:hypothetical protein